MDLPIILEERKTVDDVVEKNQEIYICLKQLYGTILHDTTKGSNLPVHVSSMAPIKDAIEVSLASIKEIDVTNITISNDEVAISYLYRGTKQLFIIPKQDVTG